MRHPDPNKRVGNQVHQQERHEHASDKQDRRKAIAPVRGLARSAVQMAFHPAILIVAHRRASDVVARRDHHRRVTGVLQGIDEAGALLCSPHRRGSRPRPSTSGLGRPLYFDRARAGPISSAADAGVRLCHAFPNVSPNPSSALCTVPEVTPPPPPDVEGVGVGRVLSVVREPPLLYRPRNSFALRPGPESTVAGPLFLDGNVLRRERGDSGRNQAGLQSFHSWGPNAGPTR